MDDAVPPMGGVVFKQELQCEATKRSSFDSQISSTSGWVVSQRVAFLLVCL